MLVASTVPQAIHLLTSALATTEHGRTQSNVTCELDNAVQCKPLPHCREILITVCRVWGTSSTLQSWGANCACKWWLLQANGPQAPNLSGVSTLPSNPNSHTTCVTCVHAFSDCRPQHVGTPSNACSPGASSTPSPPTIQLPQKKSVQAGQQHNSVQSKNAETMMVMFHTEDSARLKSRQSANAAGEASFPEQPLSTMLANCVSDTCFANDVLIIPMTVPTINPSSLPDGHTASPVALNQQRVTSNMAGVLQQIPPVEFCRNSVWSLDNFAFVPEFALHKIAALRSSQLK